ncbi:MAG: excinuclease ABC subunit UvrA [Bacteroidetes bacterium]|nr:excinuclease ABC subunit UvrA [Bacteroidota bacterium]MCL1968114.1 excinuclease ABC subunit UvrA [Bacteroidota bacterium]
MPYIEIKGARANNLQNIDVSIPRNQLVVITGLSGSGKSSLAFDTLYAEGQRRYVESLSSYARQFMGKLSKPEVEYIKGIPPAIAIEQRVISRNPRSTVGTATEIYEYLKLLFARIGKTFSPVSGKEVKRENIQDVIQYIERAPAGSLIYILAPFKIAPDRTPLQQLEILKMQGFSRMMLNRKLCDIDEMLNRKNIAKSDNLQLLIDRFKSENIQEQKMRLADSIQTAFQEGKGETIVQTENDKITQRSFSNLFEMDGIAFEEPSPLFFSFNNPYGACPVCGGTGFVDGVSPELTIPDRSKSLFNDAVVCWRGEKLQNFKNLFIHKSAKYNFPIHRPVEDLTEEQFDLLWNGNEEVIGVLPFFKMLEDEGYKVQNRVLIARYRGRTLCPKCKGTRIRKDANYVKIQEKSISDLTLISIEEAYRFFANFQYSSEHEKQIARQLVKELENRLRFLLDVGLGYLTLNRLSKTLSGGESQRINLATSLGSSLVGSLYILDEPSIGLHPRDTQNLIRVLKRLRDIGNTVIVVEHDEEIIRSADYIIDIGPKAGRLGGKIVFTGTFDNLLKTPDNLTAAYLRGMNYELRITNYEFEEKVAKNVLSIPLPKHRRKWHNYVEVKNASVHNLKNITVKFPLDIFTVITGVSGSGKSTLIKEVLYPLMQKKLQYIAGEELNDVANLHLSKETISEVILVDQNPIGRSSRSNPATYIKVYDDIRELYAQQPLAKQRNYKPGFFSFNVPGGRCETCEGEGVIHVEMQFMADVDLVCTDCNGTRFKDEALDVKINNISIADVLQMTINQAREFFESLPVSKTVSSIIHKLAPLQEVGLGYLKMGQSSSTLSGGEAQRVKLAFYLCHGNTQKNHLFIFDEPTTGLHFHDINNLYHSFNKLIEIGHSIIVIEHNPELIKCADWVIDLGPEGGDKGGYLVFEGTPEELIKCERSYTGKFLEGKI